MFTDLSITQTGYIMNADVLILINPYTYKQVRVEAWISRNSINKYLDLVDFRLL